MTELHLPPHSIEAEQSVLGGLLIDNSAFDRIGDLLSADDFYRDDHRKIYQQITGLIGKNKPADVVTVFSAMGAGLEYLGELAQSTPTSRNVRRYAEIVRDKALRRHIAAKASQIAEEALYSKIDAREIADHAEETFCSLRLDRDEDGADFQALLAKVCEEVDQAYHRGDATPGLETGFTDLDAMIDGLEPADLVIVAGRSSMGKTALAMNIVEHVAAKRVPVGVFSLEMSDKALARRILGSASRIDQKKLKRGTLSDEDWERLTQGVGRLHDAPIHIQETSGLSLSALASKARRMHRKHGLGLIVIDYLQMMDAPGENRSIGIGAVTRGLKGIAKSLNIPVVVLSQLNRKLEERANHRPMMSDLRESGDIEQDADKIIFVYRDEVYNKESEQKGIAEIIVGKNRNGPLGTVHLTWLQEFTRFENYFGAIPTRPLREPKVSNFTNYKSRAAGE